MEGQAMNAAELRQLAAAYARLECVLQQIFASTIGGHCARCSLPCCRADLCDETCGSIFLDEVRRVGEAGPSPAYSERDGWLGSRGCQLALGRPPVCYAFVCEELYEALPPHVAAVLREVCHGIEGVYSEVSQGVDLHELGSDAMRHLVAVELLAKMEALCVRSAELLAQIVGVQE
jgi:hypothetical protein